ncbi:c6 zinc finger domain containing protein [Ophiostoma piceae UAMH 11346]|uniref:C6 zinc finger domain containing protein n=1 Tax=Ophiostoma piceae (strain UAMH 11346) TaxID=1262450 RepID=S3CUU7_OPHP1|nr:c6 zinc finger domain containing protein [Ophiostoma piceae UAMH 11346]
MSPPSTTMTPAQVSEARRRKVRKGTHSCWECRRRKIRCQYSSADDIICIGCRSRGSSCRSQEFPDESPSPQQVPEKKVAQRLDRLENMMEQLMAHVLTTPTGAAHDRGARSSQTGPASVTRAPNMSSSAATSDSGGPSPLGQCPVDAGYIDDEDVAMERVKRLYRDPAEVVAHVCPTAAGKQGYGELDVLDTSTADDTPVAALLGIQDSLSHGNSTPSTHRTTSSTTRAGASGNSASSLSPESADASVDSANSPARGDGTSTSATSAGSGGNEGGWSKASDASMPTAATSDKLADPVTAIWARHLNLSKLLHSLFPSQEDVDTIASGAPAQYVVALFHTKHDIAIGHSEPPSDLREIPPVTSHPTAIGRRLMQITLCMQQMAPCYVLQNKLNTSENLSDVINRIAGVVCHTITSNDELIGSVEGLECLVLLGQQQSNAGQLRKAWLTYRRAMSLAQLMGLDRGNTRALKSCDPTSNPRTRPTPEAMWYRINACDRYVSLLLGLRAGSQDDEAFIEKEPAEPGSSPHNDTDTPVEKLEKAHTLLTGRIIERNHSKMSLEQSYTVTQAIDCDLKFAASRNLGPSWWEVPTYDPYARPEFTFKEMARSITQVHHHFILILLHLPYMLRGDNPASAAAKMMVASSSASTGACDKGQTRSPDEQTKDQSGCTSGLAYSKTTCMQSSRAVLQRFIHFRLVNNTAFSCRHVDYASLIAAMTLIIGYLGPRPAVTSDPDILDSFDNQLRKDRAMVEQVRERMEHIGKSQNDRLSRESAATIQQLLPVLDLVSRKLEEAAPMATTDSGHGMGPTNGQGRSTSTAATPVPASFRPSGGARNGGHTGSPEGVITGAEGASYGADGAPLTTPTLSAVRLNVPYFGTVNIHANNAPPVGTAQYQHPYQQQEQLSLGLSPTPMPGAYGLFSPSAPDQPAMSWNGGMPGQGQSSLANGTPQNQAQTHTQQNHDVDLNAMLVDFDPIPINGDGDGANGDGGSGAPDGGDGFFGFGGPPAFPDLTGSTDDWVMQGVDTTYWSLLNGGGGSFGGQMG